MTHLADGILRRLVDEPLAGDEGSRAHLASCEACHNRSAAIAEDARFASSLLASAPPTVEARGALARLRSRAAVDVEPDPWQRFLGSVVLRRGVLARASGAAVVLIAVVLASAATGLADTILHVFQPKQFVAVRLSPSDYRGLPDLSAFGTMTGAGGTSRQVADVAAAEAATGMRVLRPATLPAGVVTPPMVSLVEQTTMTFTFDGAVARENARRRGVALTPMPPGLDGTVLTATVGPVVIQTFQAADRRSPNGLAVIQMRTPTVTSSKVSFAALRDYLLAQPGLSDTLRAQIRAIGDPTSTLPVPLPTDTSVGEQVSIHGVRGLFIGDATGLGSGVIWQKDGFVHIVAGTMTKAVTLNVASSLR